jgi:LCP family protein required for cell wall assembly
VLGWLFVAALVWIGLSLVLFTISSQFLQEKVGPASRAALSPAGNPITSANTILVLGSDKRPANSREPGASMSSERADSIMLLRVGAGHNARLSIPRDTAVNIPGHGINKINAAYAFGGAALMTETIKQYLNIKINHIIEINFERFPELVDSLGGINYTGGCVRAKVNGGYKNGGVTLHLKKGSHHLNGNQVLALARVRINDCKPYEDDLNRALRQQQIINSIKARMTSPFAFIRLPWVSWEAPQTIRSDMGPTTLMGMFSTLAIHGQAKPRVLKPSGTTLAGGGQALVISDQTKQYEVRRFLK